MKSPYPGVDDARYGRWVDSLMERGHTPDSPEGQEILKAWADEVAAPAYEPLVNAAKSIEKTGELPLTPVGGALEAMGVDLGPSVPERLRESDNPRLQKLADIMSGTYEGAKDARTASLQSLAGILTRGIPGLATDIFAPGSETNKRIKATDQQIDTYVTPEREERSPFFSAVGDVVPDVAAAALTAGRGTPEANPYRVLSKLEKVGDAAKTGLTAMLAGGAGEAVRPGENRFDRATEGALWGFGGDLLGRTGAGTVNWLKNAKNKQSVDAALEDALNFLNPEANALRGDPKKVANTIFDETQSEFDRLRNLRGEELNRLTERGGMYGAPDTADPFILDEGLAMRLDPKYRGPSVMDVNSRAMALGEPQSVGQRMEAIKEVRAAAAAARKGGNEKEAELLDNTVARLQKEFDDFALSSGAPGLPQLGDEYRATRTRYKEDVGPFTDTSGTGTAQLIDSGYQENVLHDIFGSNDLGIAAERQGQLVPRSKDALSALWMNETFGKGIIPNPSTTASQIHLGKNLPGGKLDDATVGFLQNLEQKAPSPGPITSALGRKVNLSASELSKLQNSSILKYGATPAQQLRNNYLIAALRGALGGEALRYSRGE